MIDINLIYIIGIAVAMLEIPVYIILNRKKSDDSIVQESRKE